MSSESKETRSELTRLNNINGTIFEEPLEVHDRAEGGAVGDAKIGGDPRQQADRQELAGHEGEGADGDRADGEPGAQQRGRRRLGSRRLR